MAVLRVGGLHPRHHFAAQNRQFLHTGQGATGSRHGQQLHAAHALQPVNAPVGLGHGVAYHQGAVVFHENDVSVAQHLGQALALLQGVGQAGVVVVVGDVPVKKRRRLRQRQQPVVL